MQRQFIQLRGVRVHNLRNIDIQIPLRKMTVITGVSGAGKSSLALDTLAAEGQRRYIESFSTTARQYLDRFERPDADEIDGLPPAVTLRQRLAKPSWRTTVAKASEIEDHLRLLFARLGHIICPSCGERVQEDTPRQVAETVNQFSEGTRYQVCLERRQPSDQMTAEWFADLQAQGFSRVIQQGRTQKLAEISIEKAVQGETILVVLDRLVVGKSTDARMQDSLELAFQRGGGRCLLLIEATTNVGDDLLSIDGQAWQPRRFSRLLRCETCERDFVPLEPRLLSSRSPLGACPACHGRGRNSVNGDAEDLPICTACRGRQLRPEALAVKFGGCDISDVIAMSVAEALTFFEEQSALPPPSQATLYRTLLRHVLSRLVYLREIGLQYLPLSRPIRALAQGEARRVALTSLVATRLVNTLFILDEPTAGLHPHDVGPMLATLQQLRDAHNTLVIVDHDPACLNGSDEVIELGPGAGQEGGTVVFQGTPDVMMTSAESLTARYARGDIGVVSPSEPRLPSGWLQLSHVTYRNLSDVSAAFPLGVLCAVTGVSGSGKSSLVRGALFPLLANRFQASAETDAESTSIAHGEIAGFEDLDEVLLMDQSPLPRTARGSPVTYLKAFDALRSLFAETPEARLRNMSPATFSLHNKNGGRCPTCEGRGVVTIDMQFMADVTMTCPDCQGTRYQREVLAAKYRGLSIAEVLEMTVSDALPLFRGQPSLQKKIATLRAVGLDYLKLGQPARTLSGGESQRLKLASCLAQRTGRRTLFLLEEPTQGLHAADVGKVMECMQTLLSAGHSLIVIEHHPAVVRAADHVIDLGPGGGPHGGRIVACGTPSEIMANTNSITGKYLRT